MPSWPNLMFGGLLAVLIALALATLVPGRDQATSPQQAQIVSSPASLQ
jgi:hypothetical protein